MGIDPGLQTLGYSFIKTQKDYHNQFDVIDFGCIVTEANQKPGERLQKIYKEIQKIIKKYKPDIVSVESLYFFKNLKTALPVSQAKGVVLLSCAKNKIPVLEFTPLQVKMTIAGYGRAEKKQIQQMIKKLVDIERFDLKKNYRKKDDAIDALAVAVCGGLHKSWL
jgi:crossover junction endodeoxyribonuclease RuvC